MSEDGIRTFIQVVLFIALFMIGLKAYTSLNEWWIGSRIPQETLKSQERLAIETENMLSDSTEFPLSLDAGRQLTIFSDGKGIPGCADGKACVCVCSLDSSCENQAAQKCVSTAAKLSSATIIPHLEDGEAKAFTCTATKEGELIQVTC